MLRFNSTLGIFCIIACASAFPMCKKHLSVKPVAPDDIVETEQPDLIAVSKSVNKTFGGYYISLPKHYSKTRKKYPVLIFLHGLGQMGNGTTDLNYLLDDGIGKVLSDKKFPPNFNVNGINSSFIVVTPQMSKEPTRNEIVEFNTYIMTTYRGDVNRLYLAGLSLGGRLTTYLGATYPMAFAAIVPISGVALNPGFEDRCKSIADADLPVWEFHNEDDPLANIEDAKRFINLIRDYNPPVLPRMTIFNVYGHDAWTTALNPDYKEEGKNIYEWMLSYSR